MCKYVYNHVIIINLAEISRVRYFVRMTRLVILSVKYLKFGVLEWCLAGCFGEKLKYCNKHLFN